MNLRNRVNFHKNLTNSLKIQMTFTKSWRTITFLKTRNSSRAHYRKTQERLKNAVLRPTDQEPHAGVALRRCEERMTRELYSSLSYIPDNHQRHCHHRLRSHVKGGARLTENKPPKLQSFVATLLMMKKSKNTDWTKVWFQPKLMEEVECDLRME